MMINVLYPHTYATCPSVDAVVAFVSRRAPRSSKSDQQLIKAGGQEYYYMLPKASALTDGEVIVAGLRRKTGGFNKVIFVADGYRLNLDILVERALTKAVSRGFKTLAMPILRLEDDTPVPMIYSLCMGMIEGIQRFESSSSRKPQVSILCENEQIAQIFNQVMNG